MRLVTALLCCSQKPFFLDKYPALLTQLVANIKVRIRAAPHHHLP
jgi:hypothetical protein